MTCKTQTESQVPFEKLWRIHSTPICTDWHAKHKSIASTKKRKSHLKPSVTLRAQIEPDSAAKRRRLNLSRTRAKFSLQRNLRLPEKAQCFVQILTFKMQHWCSSSNAIYRIWLANHNQNRNLSALLFSSLLYFSRLYSTQPLPLLNFYSTATSTCASTPLLLTSTLLSSTLLWSTQLCSSLLYWSLVFSTLRSFTLLYFYFYSTLLCSTHLCSTRLYSSLLFSLLLCYTLLFSTLRFSTLHSFSLLYTAFLYSLL